MAVMVPFGAASLVDKACPAGVFCPDPTVGILVWATRPRGTAGVFLVNAIFAFWADRADRKAKAEASPNRRATQRAVRAPTLASGMVYSNIQLMRLWAKINRF